MSSGVSKWSSVFQGIVFVSVVPFSYRDRASFSAVLISWAWVPFIAASQQHDHRLAASDEIGPISRVGSLLSVGIRGPRQWWHCGVW
jgi:hypothetical protein